MVDVAQLVRVADCGSVGRGFKSHLPPSIEKYLSKDNFRKVLFQLISKTTLAQNRINHQKHPVRCYLKQHYGNEIQRNKTERIFN